MVVDDHLAIEFGSVVARAKEDAKVPITFVSSAPVTNVCFTMQYPAERVTNLTLIDVDARICRWRISPSANLAVICLEACAGTTLVGTQLVASLHFSVPKGSGFIPFRLVNVNAVRQDARAIGSETGQDGRGVVIGEEPLLEISRATNGAIWLTLFGKPLAHYQIVSTTNLWPPKMWQPALKLVLNGLSHSFELKALNQSSSVFSAFELPSE